MKKFLIVVIFTLLLSVTICPPVSAAANDVMPLAISDETVSPSSEETVWYTRIYNGILQRRLWSVTYGEWLTEWEDIGYVNQ